MDNLFRQTRLRFSGAGQEKKEEPESSRDRRIPPQKTQSFKDKKKEPSWFRKQVTWQMSQDYDPVNEDDRAMAVAAAAYAITLLETNDETKTSTVPIKSKKENPTISIPQQGRISKKFSEITQISDNPEAASGTKKPEKALFPAPSLKKTPSSSLDKQLSGSFKSGSGTPKPDFPTSITKPPETQSSSTKPMSLPAETKRQSSTRAGIGKSQADIWEAAELVKITKRYEEQRTTILSWEEKKKTKAKRRLEKAERELENKRAKAHMKYHRDIKNIDQVVGGAKAKVEEKKKNNELKVKEKANTIRKTGKVPSTCSCF